MPRNVSNDTCGGTQIAYRPASPIVFCEFGWTKHLYAVSLDGKISVECMKKRITTVKKYRRRYKRKTIKRGGTVTVACCDCEQKVELSVTLIPRKCSSKRGYNAHRICQKCWWGDEKTGKIGFADETASHKCPGCEKKMSLPILPTKKMTGQDVIEIE